MISGIFYNHLQTSSTSKDSNCNRKFKHYNQSVSFFSNFTISSTPKITFYLLIKKRERHLWVFVPVTARCFQILWVSNLVTLPKQLKNYKNKYPPKSMPLNYIYLHSMILQITAFTFRLFHVELHILIYTNHLLSYLFRKYKVEPVSMTTILKWISFQLPLQYIFTHVHTYTEM